MNQEEFGKGENIQYPEIAEEIAAMHEADQDMRKRSALNNFIIESEEDRTLDDRNTARMKDVVAEIGWPTISKVGKEIASNAWCLVQHADHDVGFQKHCLSLMKEQSESEVLPADVAYLEDRVRVNSEQLQIYGTQLQEINGEDMPREIEDREHVDERRRAVGLNTMAEYLEHFREKYKK